MRVSPSAALAQVQSKSPAATRKSFAQDMDTSLAGVVVVYPDAAFGQGRIAMAALVLRGTIQDIEAREQTGVRQIAVEVLLIVLVWHPAGTAIGVRSVDSALVALGPDVIALGEDGATAEARETGEVLTGDIVRPSLGRLGPPCHRAA